MPLIRNKRTGETRMVEATDLGGYRLAPSVSPTPTAPPSPTRDIFKGGILSDVADVLSVPQYAATGLLEGKGVMEGIRQTRTPSEALGLKGLGGFAADVVLDPLNATAALGLIGKGAKGLGLVDEASKIAKATGILKKGKLGAVVSPYEKIISKTVQPTTNALIDMLTGSKGLGKAATEGGVGGIRTLVGGKDRFLGQIAEALKPMGNKLDELFRVADETGKTIKANDIVSIIDPYLKNVPAGDYRAAENAMSKVLTDITRALGPEGSARLANAERVKLGEAIGNSFQKLTKPLKTEAQSELYFKLRELVETAAPGSKQVLQEMQPLMSLKSKMLAPKGAVGIPFKNLVSAALGAPYGALPAMTAFAGSELLRGGKTAVSAGRAIEQVSDPILRMLTKGLAGAKPSEPVEVEPGAIPTTPGVPTVPIIPSEPAETARALITPEQYQQMVLRDFVSTGGKNLTKIEALYKAAGPSVAEGKQMGEASIKQLGDLDASTVLVEQLNQDLAGFADIMGPVTGTIGKANPWNVEAKSLESKMRSIAQDVGRAMEGGVLRKEDEAKYRAILPQITDTPEIAKNKIDNVLNMLRTKRTTIQQLYQTGGYDVPELIRQIAQ